MPKTGYMIEAMVRTLSHNIKAELDGQPDGSRSYACSAWAVKGRVPA